MPVADPTLTVLFWSALAAGAASIGVLPLLWRPHPPPLWIGWANALAAGLMLGAAYTLLAAGLDGDAVSLSVGALLGAVFVAATHIAAGTEDLDLNRLDARAPEYGYQVFLVNSLHSASEGVAIGVAMHLSLPFGIFLAAAMAVHNIPEATVFSAIVTARGVRLPSAAGLSVATNVSQMLMAVATFAVLGAAPAMLPWTAGFAVGALIYLVMVELLPESYHQAGATTIGLVTVLAMGVVVLLGGFGR
jgi:zinc transporter ZupT